MKKYMGKQMIIVLIGIVFFQALLFNTIISFSVEKEEIKGTKTIENGVYLM